VQGAASRSRGRGRGCKRGQWVRFEPQCRGGAPLTGAACSPGEKEELCWASGAACEWVASRAGCGRRAPRGAPVECRACQASPGPRIRSQPQARCRAQCMCPIRPSGGSQCPAPETLSGPGNTLRPRKHSQARERDPGSGRDAQWRPRSARGAAGRAVTALFGLPGGRGTWSWLLFPCSASLNLMVCRMHTACWLDAYSWVAYCSPPTWSAPTRCRVSPPRAARPGGREARVVIATEHGQRAFHGLSEGRGRCRQSRAEQGRAGQSRAEQGRAGQGRAGQGRAGQGRAGQGRAGQGRAEQGRAGAEQGRAVGGLLPT